MKDIEILFGYNKKRLPIRENQTKSSSKLTKFKESTINLKMKTNLLDKEPIDYSKLIVSSHSLFLKWSKIQASKWRLQQVCLPKWTECLGSPYKCKSNLSLPMTNSSDWRTLSRPMRMRSGRHKISHQNNRQLKPNSRGLRRN